MINEENVRAWTQQLRNPKLQQIKGGLGKVIKQEKDQEPDCGFCCIGVAQHMIGPYKIIDVGKESDILIFENEQGFATRSLMEWLGIEIHTDVNQILSLAPEIDLDGVMSPSGFIYRNIPANELNDDWGLTFTEIADMIDYFGLVEVQDLRNTGR